MIKEMPKIGDIVNIRGKLYKVIAEQKAMGLTDPPTLKFFGFELKSVTKDEVKRWKV